MDAYRSVLEKIARRELIFTIFAVVVLLLISGIVLVCHFLHYRKMKKKQPKKYNSDKQVKARKNSLFASITLTVMCVAAAVLGCVFTGSTISKINKDIQENAYITYTGGYEIYATVLSSKRASGNLVTVNFADGGYAQHYMDYFELSSSNLAQFEGTVIYGKNSLIVVYIDGEEI